MNKQELLERIENGHKQIEVLIAGLSDEQMLHHASDELWSIADSLAHFTFWQQSMVTNLQRLERGEAMSHVAGQLDDTNAQVLAANRIRPPSLILSEFHQAHDQLIERLQVLTDEDLNEKAVTFRDGNPLWEYILGESADHYDEHLADLRAAREDVLKSQ